MPEISIYQIDAFSNKAFGGNPAAVCVLDSAISDSLMQQIAKENNLSETAFIVPNHTGWDIRWFTPKLEVPLCGHATLASAHVIFNELSYQEAEIRFQSKSGELIVHKSGDLLTLDFPAMPIIPCDELPAHLTIGLGVQPESVFKVDSDPNYFAVYESEERVSALKPDLSELEQLHPYGVVITAPGNHYDCVSRYFLPSYNIPEDPVTGSAHTSLTPYWSEKLNKKILIAKQLSERGGDIQCEYHGDRVKISGHGVCYLVGEIAI